MRRLKIFRKKHFAGCLIKYFCVVNVNQADFKEYIFNILEDQEDSSQEKNPYSDTIYLIKNGREITIDIDDSENKLFVAAYTSTGVVFSNEVIIETGSSDISYNLITKYSVTKGSSYLLIRN